MTLPLKPGETPEEIAAQVLRDVMEAERRGDNMDPIITAALKSYGDRRGEEERAKALERVTALEKLLAEERAKALEDAIAAVEDAADYGDRVPTLTAAIRSLAAAPSGDAAVSLGPDRCRSTYKAAVEVERVCTLEFGHIGAHATFPAPSGDAKGTK